MGVTEAPMSLPAREAEWSQRLRDDPRLLADMSRSAGGPFHVLYPAGFADNVRSFQNAMLTAGVDGRVFYGKKANKSGCWLTGCVDAGAGVDVASAPELVHALASGLRGDDLIITGPAKSTRLLWLAIRHRALVTVDALDELHRLLALARTTGPVRIHLRVLPSTDPHSRFGLDPEALDDALRICAAETDRIELEGFSFHLGGYEIAPRATLAAELADRCVAARALGLNPSAVSIGGGFAVSYLDQPDWQDFVDRHDDSWFHAGRRPERFYPYHQQPSGAAMLSAILDSRVRDDTTVAEAFRRAGVRLYLEPGRALLDGCGLSVFPVQGFKPQDGYGIVTVDGLSMSLSEQWKGSEFLPDPVLWPESAMLDPVKACIGGTSCLEYDMLTWRKVPFARRPQHGDLVVYLNTAGYQMDKNETEFHQLPLPTRFVLSSDDNGFAWQQER